MEETPMKKSFLFISCEEAKHICDKSQYGDSTFWERIELTIRYMWCRITKAHVKRNKKLTKALKSSHVQGLQQNEREQLIEKFSQQLKNQV